MGRSFLVRRLENDVNGCYHFFCGLPLTHNTCQLIRPTRAPDACLNTVVAEITPSKSDADTAKGSEPRHPCHPDEGPSSKSRMGGAYDRH